MKPNTRNGFSLLEVLAAVVILVMVAAATVATVTPLRQKSEDKIMIQELASLNAIAQAYYLDKGSFPPDIFELVREKYIANSTPAEKARYARLAKYSYDKTVGVFSSSQTR